MGNSDGARPRANPAVRVGHVLVGAVHLVKGWLASISLASQPSLRLDVSERRPCETATREATKRRRDDATPRVDRVRHK